MRKSGKPIIKAAFAVVIAVSLMLLATACGSARAAMEAVVPSGGGEASVSSGTDAAAGRESTAVAGTSTIQQESATAGSGAVGGSSEEAANSQEASANPSEVKKFKVKAIYLSGSSAGSSKVLDRYIDVINNTELNSVVIDVKEGGRVNYASSVPMVAENNLYVKFYDVDKVIKKLHDNNIHVIGRVVCFRDDGLGTKRADLAVKRPDGSIWKEGKLGAWTNPYMTEVWQYNIDIAKEAVAKGFDEIQFDYVRFPTAKKSEVYYGDNPPSRADTISAFLKKAKEELHDGLGVPVSADVFGIIAESRSDGEAIGQDLEKVGMDIDCISPMVYPSHYANGQQVNGVNFAKPDLEPYGVVYQTLLKAKERISKVPGYTAGIRPYLQDFTATWLHKGDYQEYGAEQVRQQIKAVYDAGYDEWILWDGRNTYTVDALEKDK